MVDANPKYLRLDWLLDGLLAVRTATIDMSRARFRLASSPHPLTPRDGFAAGLCIQPRVLAQVVAGPKVLHLDRLMAYYKSYVRRRCCGRTRDLDGAADLSLFRRPGGEIVGNAASASRGR